MEPVLEALHALWGKAKDGAPYDKAAWMRLQGEIEQPLREARGDDEDDDEVTQCEWGDNDVVPRLRCQQDAVYEAWVRRGVMNAKMRLCRTHVKESIGWKARAAREAKL